MKPACGVWPVTIGRRQVVAVAVGAAVVEAEAPAVEPTGVADAVCFAGVMCDAVGLPPHAAVVPTKRMATSSERRLLMNHDRLNGGWREVVRERSGWIGD